MTKPNTWIVAALLLALPCLVRAEGTPDPFLAVDGEAAALPAPVTPPPADTPAPSLGDAKSVPAPSSPAPAEVPAPATPSSVAPVEASSTPATESPSKPEPTPPPGVGKGIYEQYEDYLGKEREHQANEKDYSQRTMFPHENGAWQVGLFYARNAFSGYNFNTSTPSGSIPNPTPTYADTQGANLLITWFPIKSLSFGRLGFGVAGGVYWSTFNTTTDTFDLSGTRTGTTVTKATPQQVSSYGVRAVYEFDYWLGQILVPYVFLGLDNVLIKGYTVRAGSTTYVNVDARRLLSQNFGGGVHFNLNRVEPTVASKALVGLGVRKFYLSYMALQRSGDLNGLTHNIGLNFEF